MRRRTPLLVAMTVGLMLGGVAAEPVPRPSAHPLRVMSIDVCADQIVLALLPPARITSVTWLARDPELSLMVGQAAAVGINHGFGEEVLRDRPDLVVAGTFTSTATRQLLKVLGWPILEVGPADTMDQIRRNTRRIAVSVGASAPAEALLARMDRQLAELARYPGSRLRIAAWDGGGFSAARGSLHDLVITLAGAVNVAADPAFVRKGAPDTEVLLATAPALLVRGGGYDRNDLRANIAQHPLVRRFWGKDRSLTIRQAYTLCGTPFIADAALKLRAELHAAATAAATPLPFTPKPSR